MELAVSSFLGTFASEHGTDGVELGDRIGGVEVMFEVGPDNRSRSLRPERQAFIAPIPKGVHLLFHDIRGFPNPPGEEICLFQNGDADLAATEGGENSPCLIFHILPSARFLGEDILKTFYSGNEFHRLSIQVTNFTKNTNYHITGIMAMGMMSGKGGWVNKTKRCRQSSFPPRMGRRVRFRFQLPFAFRRKLPG